MTEINKVCKICKFEKTKLEFNKSGNGLNSYCKPCDKKRKAAFYIKNKESIRQKQKEYYLINSESIKQTVNEYRITNSTVVKKRKSKYYISNKEAIRKKSKERYASDVIRYRLEAQVKRSTRKEKINDYNRYKSKTDVEFRLLKNLRSRVRHAVKNANTIKSNNTETLLGCSILFLKNYFYSLFTEGMSWELFMEGEIHIDHIKPCVLFNLKIETDQKKCFHYTNLQPLWKKENLIKGISYTEK